LNNPALAELAARFLQNAKADAATLEQALAAENFTRIEQVAHSLAGAAGIFGLTQIGTAALAIDDRFARGERPERHEVETLIARIHDHS
jgi:HPt (histidine-containing phosphotransfer) domain-containing protein